MAGEEQHDCQQAGRVHEAVAVHGQHPAILHATAGPSCNAQHECITKVPDLHHGRSV